MKEIRSRIRRTTCELNGLLEQLAAIQEKDAQELVVSVLTPEIVQEFKSSIDAMRRVLWVYMQASAGHASVFKSDLKSQGLVQTLRSARRSGSPGLGSAQGSFIEKVEAIVDKKIPLLPGD
jgi:hypothetical protein